MIFVVGESHGRDSIHHQTSSRLASWMGIPWDQMMRQVFWFNLFETTGTDPALLADVVESAAQPHDAILLLGRRVATGFGFGHLKPWETIVRGGGQGPTIVLVPHPSGRSRWWNDPDHVHDAELALGRIWRQHRGPR